jgi:hypothetical protein
MRTLKKLEEKMRKFEWETRDALWKLNNPPKFKYGDQVSLDNSNSSHAVNYERLTILGLKETKSFNEDHYYFPIHIYLASIGGMDVIGKNIIEVREWSLSLIKE